MQSLRSMCGVSRKDRCRNRDVRERCGLKKDVVTREERGMLQWLAIWEGASITSERSMTETVEWYTSVNAALLNHLTQEIKDTDTTTIWR
ncbi:hypothetical protein EVAR_76777_1 [Eumeta japonica]|uniref:Uncharacterized protein n=1 Tax=Eumeta variegata TaxID=151549 RepID=A0A4C1SVT6_EUMVA|nr:hypothetical protein EVAR_76777_1 [Eumeta japonica]